MMEHKLFTADDNGYMPKEFDEAIAQIKKAYTAVQAGHPYVQVDVYELKDGSTMVDQCGYGFIIFPKEHDTIRWIKNLVTNIDGSSPVSR